MVNRKNMDEFSWFVGLYEGEGCFGSRRWKRKYKDKVYEGSGIYLTIKMTDEDTISRAAKFLKQKYSEVEKNDRAKRGYKKAYRVRQMGGINENGKLYTLIQRMLPHLSERRQQQIKGHIEKARNCNLNT